MSLYLLNECKCRLYILYIFNGDYAAATAFAHLALELACRDVAHDSAKEFACIVPFVACVDKEQVHLAAFEVYLLNAQPLSLVAQ